MNGIFDVVDSRKYDNVHILTDKMLDVKSRQDGSATESVVDDEHRLVLVWVSIGVLNKMS